MQPKNLPTDLPSIAIRTMDTAGAAYMTICMANHLRSTQPDAGAAYLAKQKPERRALTESALMQCEALDWLLDYSRDQITQRLHRMQPESAELMRQALNIVRGMIKRYLQTEDSRNNSEE